MDASTDATEAVSLGNEKLFQSYIVCSDHGGKDASDNNAVSTRLTYGKIKSGIFSTIASPRQEFLESWDELIIAAQINYLLP